MRTALSIAGSDSSGGAGVQADLKTMTMNGVFAMSAITALTAQNTTGVTGILEADPEFLKKQIDAVFEDISPDAVKIGMVSSSGLIKTIAERLQHYKAENIVVDPVMVATSGSRLLEEDAVDTLKKELLPIATVITPNIPEAEILCGMEIHTEEDMVAAAKAIYEDLGCAVLLKGGHNINDANDLLYTKEEVSWFKGKRINNPNTHGTGCTLSSAIAANLAKGFDLKISVQRANNKAPVDPKLIFTVSIALFLVFPPINPAKNIIPHPMICPMMIANNPVENPKDAKYVPVKISAKDTPAPNQISPFSKIDVLLLPIVYASSFHSSFKSNA